MVLLLLLQGRRVGVAGGEVERGFISSVLFLAHDCDWSCTEEGGRDKKVSRDRTGPKRRFVTPCVARFEEGTGSGKCQKEREARAGRTRRLGC